MSPATVEPQSFASFGGLLRHLRLRAGLSQRDLALAVGYHFAHISRLENNQRLPDAATLRALFVPALGLDDQPLWADRLLALAAEGRGEPHPGPVTLTHSTVHASRIEQVVVPEAAPPVAPAAQTLFPAAEVPKPLTLTVGRDDDLAGLVHILAREDVRLLTLIGPPGVGKTRLAIEAARRAAGAFAHGAAFVDLTPITDPDSVALALARALDAKDAPGQSPWGSLIATLRERHLLLVLDNYEQVIASAPALSDLLGQCPRLKVLVTSREALRVSGENEYPVAPLPSPAPDGSAGLGLDVVAALAPYAAVQLFVQRARAVQPGFQLTPANAPAIADICARLDGLPLAIELAAARIKIMTPAEMRAQLGRRFQWLTRGARDGPAWRQTLRGAVEWSYNLLAPAEAGVFARLAVFRGGFTAEAIEAVCGSGDDTLDALGALLDKSLISATTEDSTHGSRFSMLETLREYAYERFLELGNTADAVRDAHAAHCLGLLSQPASVGETDWLALVASEHDNCRAGLTWLMKRDPPRGREFALLIWRFWNRRGHWSEARRWLGQALPGAPDSERMRLNQALGEACWQLGDLAAARVHLEAALSVAQARADRHAETDILSVLGRVLKDSGAFREAGAHLQRGVALARDIGNQGALVTLLRNTGNVHMDLGELDAARECFGESIALGRALGDRFQVAGSLNNLGIALIELKDYAAAEACFRECLDLFTTDGNVMGEALVNVSLGRIDHAHGRMTDARERFTRSLALSRQIGRRWSEAYALNNLGLLACDLGDVEDAARMIMAGLRTAMQGGAVPRVLDGLCGWARVLALRGEPQAAARLVAIVLQHPASEHETVERAEGLRAALAAHVEVAGLTRAPQAADEWLVAARGLIGAPPG